MGKMNLRGLNAMLWGNSVALSWMWGLGLFFSVQITFMFGLQGLLLFAVPNAIGLTLFGWMTQVVANRAGNDQESLARFFDKFVKPFRLAFYLYQIAALALTVFALADYLFTPLKLVEPQLYPLYITLSVFVILAAGCLFGEEFGIQKIKYSHALLGAILLVCIGFVLFHFNAQITSPFAFRPILGEIWKGPSLLGFSIPLIVGLLVGPWLDLQHWQRAIQIHREKTSIRGSYVIGGIIFFLLLMFHGFVANLVMQKMGIETSKTIGLDNFYYAHDLVTQYFQKEQGIAGLAYFSFLVICVLTTLDSGYIALKWTLGSAVDKSKSMLVSLAPKALLSSPILSFLVVGIISLIAVFTKIQLEYFMVLYASFFVGYAALAIARCFVPNSQQPLPQIRMFSMASMSVVLFAFGYFKGLTVLMWLGSLLPLLHVAWLVFSTDLLRVVSERAGEVIEAASEIPAIKAMAKTAIAATGADVTAPKGNHDIHGHFEGKWFVYSMVASYADTNSVGNVYFGMYGLFVGKTRELFFNTAMPDFDLKTTSFYILTRSFEHKFIRESKEFDTITIKIRISEVNRKFCTLEHQIFGTDHQLLGKGKQSLLFVSSKDYGIIDIPTEAHTAFMPYL